MDQKGPKRLNAFEENNEPQGLTLFFKLVCFL